MSKVYRVGIAGYGIVGKRRQKFINQHENLETVAVCDRVFKEKFSTLNGLNCYQCYKELIENEKLDILFVCMTNDIAPEVTIAALEKNLHVFCEKPPGRTVTDIKNVIKVERQHPNLKLKYGFNHRYHDSIQDALEIISSNKFGKIINIRGVYGKAYISPWQEPSEKHWRTKRSLAGGGILLDQGIHMVDLMILFAGKFSEVKSFVSNDFWKMDVEDNAYALMKTDDNIVAMLHSTATQWRHRFKLDINLEHGSIILHGILSGTKSYGQETLTKIYRNPQDGGNTKEQTMSYIDDNSWWKEICEFTDAIIQDTPIKVGDSKQALESMRLVNRIYCADDKWREQFGISEE